jgi:hypothetical protein
MEMFCFREASAVGRLANDLLVEAEGMVVGREFAPMRIIVGPFHRADFFLDGKFFPASSISTFMPRLVKT